MHCRDGCYSIVIFGSTGDLARTKLVPALFALDRRGQLAGDCRIIGFARRETGDDAIRGRFRDALADACRPDRPPAADLERFLGRVHAHRGEYDDPASYRSLAERLPGLAGCPTPCRLFYLAVPPVSFLPVIRNLGSSGLAPRGSGRAEHGWSRVVVEKPFGSDLSSARALNRDIASCLSEDQVYRIDHYLAKETVQNILVLRFANGIFEPLWNGRYVDHVQMTIAETSGIGRRAPFYEGAGALRDIFQNHLLQVLTFVAMEPPASFAAESIRDEQHRVLDAIRRFKPCDLAGLAVRGQYGAGSVGGKAVPGYRAEPGVAPDSRTETYVATKLFIDNARWNGVPFYLRTGKRLARTMTEAVIRFAHIPPELVRDLPEPAHQPNEMVIRIQPDEGISLSFNAKEPGPGLAVRPARMDFSYAESFGAEPPPAYERVLLDALRGDPSLFIRADVAEAAWEAVQPLLDCWASGPPPAFPDYAAGSWGPAAADELLSRDGRKWRTP